MESLVQMKNWICNSMSVCSVILSYLRKILIKKRWTYLRYNNFMDPCLPWSGPCEEHSFSMHHSTQDVETRGQSIWVQICKLIFLLDFHTIKQIMTEFTAITDIEQKRLLCCHESAIWSFLWLSLYHTHNEVVGRYIDFIPSVCPSIHPASRVRSVAPTVLVGSISYLYILSSNNYFSRLCYNGTTPY